MRIVGNPVHPSGARGLQVDLTARARILAAVTTMTIATSCFQLEPIEVETPIVNVPPIVDLSKVEPAMDSVVKLQPSGIVSFKVPFILDANGFEEEEIYGRWWVDYRDHPQTLSATDIYEIHRMEEEIPTEDASTDDSGTAEGKTCQGCVWEASFSVDPSAFSEGACHQILAVFSDSPWNTCPGMQCTETPTILARAVWWIWVDDGSGEPGISACGQVENIDAGP